MTKDQAEAFLRGFHDELEKGAGVVKSLMGLGRVAKRVVAPGAKSKATLGQRVTQLGRASGAFVKKHPGATAGAAGAAGLGAGYMATR